MTTDPTEPLNPPPTALQRHEPALPSYAPTHPANAPPNPARALTGAPPSEPYQRPPPMSPRERAQADREWLRKTISEQHGRDLQRARTRRYIEPKDEAAFVREYVRTGRNAELAAKRIGIPAHHAETFLRRAGVQELLRTWAEVALTAQDVTIDRTLATIGDAAFADRRKAFDPDTGDLLPAHLLPDDLAGIIDKVGRNGSYTLMSRSTGLQYVMAALGMNKTTTKLEGGVSVALSSLSLDDLIAMSQQAAQQQSNPEEIIIEFDEPPPEGK